MISGAMKACTRKLRARIRDVKRHGVIASVRDILRRRHLKEDSRERTQSFVHALLSPERESGDLRKETPPADILFSIVTPLYNTPEHVLREMLQSVRKQTWTHWELCLADGSDENHDRVGELCRETAKEDARIRYRKLSCNMGISGNSNAALEMAAGDYLVLLDHDDLLMPEALLETARVIDEQGADFIYSDELIFTSPDVYQVTGIRLKPDYAPDFLLSNNYICHLAVFRKELLKKAGGFRSVYDGCQDYDLFLRMTHLAEKVVHIPKVLYLWRAIPGSVALEIHEKEYVVESGKRAIHDFLRDTEGIETEVTQTFPAMFRVKYPIPGHPTIRIFIEMQGKVREDGWENFRMKTETGEIRICAVEPGERSRAEVLRAAAAKAEEDYLLFVQGIPFRTSPDWIQEMLMLARRSGIGAVGAKVLTRENAVRNAGIILGMGERGLAGRAYYRMDGNSAGYFSQMSVVQDVSCVSCECMMVSREKYRQAGGFDPVYRDALFDLDLCLRLRELGYYNLMTPHATIQSGSDTDFRFDYGEEHASYAMDAKMFRKRWGEVILRGDPFYNPNLSLKYEDWRLRSKTERSVSKMKGEVKR